MEVWKNLSKWVICRFHFNLPGCKHHETFNPSTNQNLRLLTMSRTSITPPAHLKMAVKNQIPPTPYGKRTLPTLEEKETNFPNCKVFPWLQCINFNVAMYLFPTSKYFNVSIFRSIYLAMSRPHPSKKKRESKNSHCNACCNCKATNIGKDAASLLKRNLSSARASVHGCHDHLLYKMKTHTPSILLGMISVNSLVKLDVRALQPLMKWSQQFGAHLREPISPLQPCWYPENVCPGYMLLTGSSYRDWYSLLI